MYLKEGEVLVIQDLLYGLMLHSGNDAAVALAIYCGGTVEGFVDLMNDKARLLGLDNTHFANPNGLDHPEHYSTARDLAVLSAYAMENPVFAHTVSSRVMMVGQRSMRNHNKLLWTVDGADGIKTGFTKKAGRILVSSAVRDGRRLIAVTIHDPNDWQDHKILLEDGFARYTLRQLVAAGQQLGTVEIMSGTEKRVPVLSGDSFSYAMASGEQATIVLPEPGFVYAPVSAGGEAGFAMICIGGKTVGKVPIVYGQTVELEPEEKHRFWDGLFGG